ncbi:hypothetical protein OG735_01205 [Streptomyces sp. NBC_01210]|uniref:hypothetical protein n=1 Tax=Streptomyces sp. NBC_01210 TaxID=2903774 RepID=UPI002E0FF2D0|nr:hypothetical protein OG735_01205 [Streptomyces sp. NBC_01210]
MRNPFRKIAIVSGVMTAATTMAIAPAMASPTHWTVGPNSKVSFSALSLSTVMEVNGIPVTCPTATLSGEMFGAEGNPAHLGDISVAAFGSESEPCTSPFGPVGLTAGTSPAWRLTATGYDAATGSTTGYITGIHATLTAFTCTFEVTGEVNAAYTNSTGVLTISNSTRQLTVVGASAECAGITKDGDHPTFNGDYSVVTPSGGTAHPTVVGTE